MEWISVKDGLPENNEKVLLMFNYNSFPGNCYTGVRFDELVFLTDKPYEYGCESIKRVTHWMPLPKPPTP